MFVLYSRPDVSVFALEASSGTFQVLDLNRIASGLSNWRTFHAALWSESGFVAFEDAALSVSSRVVPEATQMPPVPAITLESFREQNVLCPIALLKLDIEGGEEEVLRVSTAVLPMVDNMVVEVHPALSCLDNVVEILWQFFARLEYASVRQSKKALIWASENRFASRRT